MKGTVTMDDAERLKLMEEAKELHDAGEHNLLQCGERLLRIRESLKTQKHGQWTKWLGAHCRWTHQYANRLIKAYQVSLAETETPGSASPKPKAGGGPKLTRQEIWENRIREKDAALDKAAVRIEALEVDLDEARSELANTPRLTDAEAEKIRAALKGEARKLFDSKFKVAEPVDA